MIVSSPERTWKARIDTDPVARVMSPGSIAAIRPIGTDAAPAGQLDDHAEGAGLLAFRADGDHDVADTSDGVEIRASDLQSDQTARVDAGDSTHAPNSRPEPIGPLIR